MGKNVIKIKAYAKINLSLYITGKCSDGYHELDSVMVPVSLHDVITICKQKSGIQITCNTDIPTDKNNTVYIAARIMMNTYHDIYGVDITIEKNIPVMAGLGGGSADAAATILGLDTLYQLNMSRQAQLNIAKKIGADVPFFTGKNAARVQGIGEVLTPISVNNAMHLVLIKPKAQLSTPIVYGQYDTSNADMMGGCGQLIAYLASNNLPDICSELHNDLQHAAIELCPDVSDALAFLKSHNACGTLMTGSGSCVFGIFKNKDDACRAVQKYHATGTVYYAITKDVPLEIET